jgi:hypothetical protein
VFLKEEGAELVAIHETGDGAVCLAVRLDPVDGEFI